MNGQSRYPSPPSWVKPGVLVEVDTTELEPDHKGVRPYDDRETLTAEVQFDGDTLTGKKTQGPVWLRPRGRPRDDRPRKRPAPGAPYSAAGRCLVSALPGWGEPGGPTSLRDGHGVHRARSYRRPYVYQAEGMATGIALALANSLGLTRVGAVCVNAADALPLATSSSADLPPPDA
ncbi:hypothetical protein OG894_44530 (plasmid) [Streptomyces sp. NBC_01724]|uniref:hypothetical protein n=1 Tax=Streptomyces sp. NBC_01724 TaxID=2975922 RepID=UPI002E37478E|nr:hypothetical protein [Streptomyces sp. NBC_01724]